MLKVRHEFHYNTPQTHIVYADRRRYGFFKFVGDCLMTLFTGGLWLIWIFVREMRGR